MKERLEIPGSFKGDRMRRYLQILYVFAGILFCSASTAQIVLEPSSYGTVDYQSMRDNPTVVRDSVIMAGESRTTSVQGSDDSVWIRDTTTVQGVLEFRIDTPALPLSRMTENNFKAGIYNLDGLPFETSETTRIILFDLGDDTEDDKITRDDFDSIEPGDWIAKQRFDGKNSCASFSKVDVTEELRRDLFGSGQGQKTTGFVLMSLEHAMCLEDYTGDYSTTISPWDGMNEPVLFFAKTGNDTFGTMPFLLVEIEGYDAGQKEVEVSHDPCADTGEYERYLDSLGLDKGNQGDEGSGCTYFPVFRKPGIMILLQSIESLFFSG